MSCRVVKEFTVRGQTINNYLDNFTSYTIPGLGRKRFQEERFSQGIKSRLPKHYQEFHRLWKKGPQEFTHIRPNPAIFHKDEFGQVWPVQNVNIPVIYPEEFHRGLWGGEGIVKGLRAPPITKHKPNYVTPYPRYWFPILKEGVVYSEILGRHIRLTATERGLQLVDKHSGFDLYLLKTPVNEIYADVLLRIKREILLALLDAPQWADKYGQFIVSHEEADWHGLPLRLAIQKQLVIEEAERKAVVSTPKKNIFRQELIQMLRDGCMEDVDPDILYAEEKKPDGFIKSKLRQVSKAFYR